jgi:arsenate reductase
LPFNDPAAFEGSDEETLEEFRTVRDQIGEAMKIWKPEVERKAE